MKHTTQTKLRTKLSREGSGSAPITRANAALNQRRSGNGPQERDGTNLLGLVRPAWRRRGSNFASLRSRDLLDASSPCLSVTLANPWSGAPLLRRAVRIPAPSHFPTRRRGSQAIIARGYAGKKRDYILMSSSLAAVPPRIAIFSSSLMPGVSRMRSTAVLVHG